MTAHTVDANRVSPGAVLALLVLGAASIVALLSFGGQIVLAPLLVPIQWMVARRYTTLVRAVFNVLAALLMTEFFVIVGTNALDSDTAAAVVGLGLGVVATVVFYRTTRPVAEAD